MDSAVNVDVEGGFLQKIGGFGIYQKILCVVVVGTINGLCALSLATQLFSLVTPDHWCRNSDVAALEEQLPLTRENTKKFSIPVVPTGQFMTSMFSRVSPEDGFSMYPRNVLIHIYLQVHTELQPKLRAAVGNTCSLTLAVC